MGTPPVLMGCPPAGSWAVGCGQIYRGCKLMIFANLNESNWKQNRMVERDAVDKAKNV